MVKNLFASSINEDEAVFLYLDCSGIIVKTVSGTVGFDIANFLRNKEIDAIESLDLLFFTHIHEDHFDLRQTLEIFRATGVHIVAEPLVAKALEGKIPSEKLTAAVPERMYAIGDFKISTIKGIHGAPINLYFVSIGELNIFHAGDSGYVPLKVPRTDLAFLPTGRNPSKPEQAFRMALALKPKVAVAMHGTPDLHKKFQRKVLEAIPETKVIIPKPYSCIRASVK